MEFNLKQLFTLVDGRLACDISDVYIMLNLLTGETLMTDDLPVATNFIKEKQLDCITKATKIINQIKEKVGNDFDSIMDFIDSNYEDLKFNLTEMTPEQKQGFGDYMKTAD